MHRFNTLLINISSLCTFIFYADSEGCAACVLWLSVVSNALFCARYAHCAALYWSLLFYNTFAQWKIIIIIIIVFLVLSYISYVAALLLCYTCKINVFKFYSKYLCINILVSAKYHDNAMIKKTLYILWSILKYAVISCSCTCNLVVIWKYHHLIHYWTFKSKKPFLTQT